jgi:cytosine/adenosine deaminase-related metal-dependent hydrolase
MAGEKITAIEATYVMVPDNGSQTILRDKTVVVEGDRIKEVSDHYDGPVDRRIKAEGRLLSPGFINCHTHVGCATYSRGMAEDRDLVEGSAFYHYFVPLLTIGYKHFTPDEMSALLEWDILEMIKKGSTTILEENFGGYDSVIEIVNRLGNRAYISYSYPNQVSKIGYLKDGKLCYDKPDPIEVGKGLRRGLEMYDKYNGSASDRIRVRLSPTGPDTCPPEVLRDTRKAADRLGCGISIHAAHHSTEVNFCRNVFNASPIEHLANTGILGPDTIITHVTYTDEKDRNLLAASNSTVVHCSYRKAREAVISPYHEYVEKGINVALGTDSFSSDITETIKMAGVLGKIRMERVGVPTAVEVMGSATLSGAKGLGRDDIGQIKAGAKADMVLIDLTKTHNFPVIEPIKNFVYYSFGTDVETVMINGKIVIENGIALTTDESALRKRVQAAADRIWAIAAREGALPGVSFVPSKKTEPVTV